VEVDFFAQQHRQETMGITADWKYFETNAITSSSRYLFFSAIYPRKLIFWIDQYVKLPYRVLYYIILGVLIPLLSVYKIIISTFRSREYVGLAGIGLLVISLIGNLILFEKLFGKTLQEIYLEGQTFPSYRGNLSFNLDGIPLSMLLEFVEECGGRQVLENLTTSEVCEKYLKPMTKTPDGGNSYCQYMKNKMDSRVTQATVFFTRLEISIFRGGRLTY
jgi:hypothetical protein